MRVGLSSRLSSFASNFDFVARFFALILSCQPLPPRVPPLRISIVKSAHVFSRNFKAAATATNIIVIVERLASRQNILFFCARVKRRVIANRVAAAVRFCTRTRFRNAPMFSFSRQNRDNKQRRTRAVSDNFPRFSRARGRAAQCC